MEIKKPHTPANCNGVAFLTIEYSYSCSSSNAMLPPHHSGFIAFVSVTCSLNFSSVMTP